MVIGTRKRSWWAANTRLLYLLVVTVLHPSLNGTSAEGFTEYTCSYKGGQITITCHTSSDNYACCYNRYATEWYSCGELTCFGQVFYEPPDGTVTKKITTPRSYGSSEVRLSTLLMLVIPVTVIGIAGIGVAIAWFYACIKRGSNATRTGSDVRVAMTTHNDDVENTINESIQDTPLNVSPPEYNTAVSLLASVSTDDPEPPPAYDSSTDHMTSLLSAPPSYASATALP